MSAPITERRSTRNGGHPAAVPAPNRKPVTAAATAFPSPRVSPERTSQIRTRPAAAGERARGATATPRTHPAGRAQFVTLVMVLLVGGLVATLWLSTAAAADSYALQAARNDARSLGEQSERLHREVENLRSTPELARRAGELGLVPVRDPARIVLAPDGTVTVVGEPRAAHGRPITPDRAVTPGAGAPAGAAPGGAPAPAAIDPATADPATTDTAATDTAATDTAATDNAATDTAATDAAAAQDAATAPVQR